MAIPIALLLQLASSVPGLFKMFSGGGGDYTDDPVLKAVMARAGVLKSRTAKEYSRKLTEGIAGIGADDMLGSSRQRDTLVRLEEAKQMADAEVDTMVGVAEAPIKRDYAARKRTSQTNLLKTIGAGAGAVLGYTTGDPLMSMDDRLQRVLGYTSVGSSAGGVLASAITGEMDAGSAEEMVAGIRALSSPDVTELAKGYREFMNVGGEAYGIGSMERVLNAYLKRDRSKLEVGDELVWERLGFPERYGLKGKLNGLDGKLL